jgi:hypothetical protein
MPGRKLMARSAPPPFVNLSSLALAPRHLPMTLIPLRAIPLRLKIWRSSRSTTCLIHPFPSRNVNVAYAGSPRDRRNFRISASIYRNRENNPIMPYHYAINDDVLFHPQEPQGRDVPIPQSVYTVTALMPIEADGRFRYRIKSKTEKLERVVTEEQISQLG